jgi:hypothetical protein
MSDKNTHRWEFVDGKWVYLAPGVESPSKGDDVKPAAAVKAAEVKPEA